VELAYRFLGDGTAFGCYKLRNVGIGNGKTAYAGNIGVKHHTMDVTGGYGLLVYDGAYV
jgi:hypothetical protein